MQLAQSLHVKPFRTAANSPRLALNGILPRNLVELAQISAIASNMKSSLISCAKVMEPNCPKILILLVLATRVVLPQNSATWTTKSAKIAKHLYVWTNQVQLKPLALSDVAIKTAVRLAPVATVVKILLSPAKHSLQLRMAAQEAAPNAPLTCGTICLDALARLLLRLEVMALQLVFSPFSWELSLLFTNFNLFSYLTRGLLTLLLYC